MLWNPRSLQNKLSDFVALLDDEDLDIVAITETWMSGQHSNITAELRDKGYSMYHFNREKRKGGGVALVFKSNFKFIKGKTFNSENYECIHVSIACHGAGPVNFIVVYRYCEVKPSVFFTEFYPIIENIFINFKNVIILGDFNLHVNEKLNPAIVQFYDILSSFSLEQVIEGSTHKLGNTLDLVIHDICDTTISEIRIDFTSKSDHAYVFFKVTKNVETKRTKTVIIKDFKNVNFQTFKSDLTSKVEDYVCNTDRSFSEAISDFNYICNVCVGDHVATKQVVVNVTPRPKWMDSEFVKFRAQRRKLYKRWKRTRSDTDCVNFENARHDTEIMALDKRCKFYSTSIENCENSHKELFGICRNLLDNSGSSKLPTYTSPVIMADTFNSYFIEKIENIRSSFSGQLNTGLSHGRGIYCGPTLSQFNPISSEELKKIILSKPIKTSAQDPLPAMFFKGCLNELLPALTILVNLSLSEGSMDGLKDTVITPLLKKAGLDPEVLKNYRPICNILYLSKLIERTALIQSNEHLDVINGHAKFQSGYKSKHSCETLLTRITNDIFVNLDKSKCTIMLLLDLSAAFDTVDHNVLLDILWYELGFRGTVFRWFVEFLKDRRQAVSIDGQKSNLKENNFGVPQGSVVGPFLFNIYVRNLINTMELAGFIIHGYADDHTLLYSFHIDFQVSTMRKIVPQGLVLVANWMNEHFLKLNPTKSQVIVFYPKEHLGQAVFDRLLLSGGSYIQISREVLSLGLIIDAQLTFSPYISSMISQGYHLIRNVSSIRKYLSTKHVKTLVNSIVIAKVDNCNSLLYGISAFDSDRLQKFQNSCARLIYWKGKYDHVSGILKELHWLPTEVRTYFKLLCCVFKCLHDLAPSYLSELINIRREYDLSLIVPRCASRVGDRAFSVSGPRLWNALPVEIRQLSTLGKFKSQLKHLFFSSFQHYKLKINVFRT